MTPGAYEIAADLVVVVHFLYIAFAVGGGLLVLRWRLAAALHLPAAAWAVIVQVFGRGCPLTPLENAFREQGTSIPYASGFVERYLLPVLYPSVMTPGLHVALGVAVLLLNVAIYALVWRRIRRPAPATPNAGAACDGATGVSASRGNRRKDSSAPRADARRIGSGAKARPGSQSYSSFVHPVGRSAHAP